MHLLLDTTPTLYPPKKADEIAAILNEADDWDYRVVHDPNGTGFSYIDIFDEAGAFVAKWHE